MTPGTRLFDDGLGYFTVNLQLGCWVIRVCAFVQAGKENNESVNAYVAYLPWHSEK